MPEGVGGVTAIAAGRLHALALRGDGSLAAWGSDGHDQGQPPPTTEAIVGIKAG